MRRLLTAAAILALLAPAVMAQENYESWGLLTNPFESTSGGGVMIDGYDPVVAGGRCTTDFSVKMPDGAIYMNEVEFDAVPAQGGILCTNGRWKAKDGSASGTTPYRVFIKNGVRRASAT